MLSLLSGILGLFGCKPKDKQAPFMLDGDGMVYEDKNYRTEFANALPFDEIHPDDGFLYFAAAYLGKGESGKKNIQNAKEKLFLGKISEEKLNEIEHLDFGGEDWFLVIPRYNEECVVTSAADSDKKQSVYNGTPFTVNCDEVTLYIWAHGGQTASLKSDENGKISSDDIWDVSALA